MQWTEKEKGKAQLLYITQQAAHSKREQNKTKQNKKIEERTQKKKHK